MQIPHVPHHSLYLAILTAITMSSAIAEDNVVVLPVITVVAEDMPTPYKSGNMDIPRTQDDVQAYTFIEREVIERSGATTVTELLSKVLPMSTSTNNSSYFTASSSQINLRGLGASQTLVLINGRRSAGTGNRGTSESTDQPNLNNIPLAAIERIEVLPTSAAAIYGSGAVGGVINVILRKDYAGTQVDLRYADTTDNKQPVSSINVVSGFALEEGRTHVMMTASKKDTNGLLVQEKDWNNKARQNILKNNPNSIYGKSAAGTVANNPPAGNLTNIRTKDGSELMTGWGSSYAHIPADWNDDTTMERYIWTINGKKFSDAEPLKVKYGERIRIKFINDSMMAHPMHLHGMFMQLENGQESVDMPNKHTLIVPPGKTVTALLTADELGEWAIHCHLLYHMSAGMMNKLIVANVSDEQVSTMPIQGTNSTQTQQVTEQKGAEHAHH